MLELGEYVNQEYKEKWEAVGHLEKESNAESQPTLK